MIELWNGWTWNYPISLLAVVGCAVSFWCGRRWR